MKLIITIVVTTLVYYIQYKIYKDMWDKNLDVDLRFENECVWVGEKSVVLLTVKNKKALSMPLLHVKYRVPGFYTKQTTNITNITDAYYRNDVFSIMGNQKITRKVYFEADRRGYYTMNSLNLTAKDFFMTKTFAKLLKIDSHIYVLPQKENLEKIEMISESIVGDYKARRRYLEDMSFFRGIREYNNNDSFRKVNWNATAKVGKLMSNVYDSTSTPKAQIYLNLETNTMFRPEMLREKSICITASISEYMRNHNIEVEVKSNGIDKLTKECESVIMNPYQADSLAVDKYLSRIEESSGIEYFIDLIGKEIQNINMDRVLVVISPYIREDLLQKLDYLKKTGVFVYMIVPYYDSIETVFSREYMYGWEVMMNAS